MFSCGFWKRVPERGALAPEFHEIMLILEGEVRVTRADGRSLAIAPGDVLTAPHGSRATWHSHSPVYKLWAVHHGAAESLEPDAVLGADVGRGGSRTAFASADGCFRAGLWDLDAPDVTLDGLHDGVLYLLEGAVAVATRARTQRAGAGDLVIAPRGIEARCSAKGRTRAFWARYQSSP
jgi:uncharacterized cupin superfamily protein